MPITREEKLLNSIANGTSSGITPITREEQYLSYIAGESSNKPKSPITRKEFYLDKISQGGGGGGGGSTDKTDLAGCYTPDGTFSDRRFTWLEMMLNWSENNNSPGYGQMGGMYNQIDALNLEDYSYYDVVVPDEITRLAMFLCRNIVISATLLEFPSESTKYFEKMYIKATTPPFLYQKDLDAMQSMENITIIVPIGCGNVYKSATNWSYYADRIFEGEMPI